MNRFFKIVRQDGSVTDIIADETAECAEIQAVFRSCNAHLNFRAVECSRNEWWSWSVIDWRQVDRLENDMSAMDTF